MDCFMGAGRINLVMLWFSCVLWCQKTEKKSTRKVRECSADTTSKYECIFGRKIRFLFPQLPSWVATFLCWKNSGAWRRLVVVGLGIPIRAWQCTISRRNRQKMSPSFWSRAIFYPAMPPPGSTGVTCITTGLTIAQGRRGRRQRQTELPWEVPGTHSK